MIDVDNTAPEDYQKENKMEKQNKINNNNTGE